MELFPTYNSYTALVIDDQTTSRVILAHIVSGLSSADRQVIPVQFSESPPALEWAKSNQADIVLVDYMMANETGIDVVKTLRALANYRSVPIIMVTSTIDVSVRYAALEAGVTDFMTKPLDIPECHARCRNLLEFRTLYLELTKLKEDR